MILSFIYLGLWFANILLEFLSICVHNFLGIHSPHLFFLWFLVFLSFSPFPSHCSFPPFLSSFLILSFACSFLSSFWALIDSKATFPLVLWGGNLEEGTMDLILFHNYSDVIAILGPKLKWHSLIRLFISVWTYPWLLSPWSCEVTPVTQFLGICMSSRLSSSVLLRYSVSFSGFHLSSQQGLGVSRTCQQFNIF